MISSPRKGDRVIIRYRGKLKSWFPLEGKIGVIAIPRKRRRQPLVGVPIVGCREFGPINHGVLVDGQLFVIPCGNLFPAPPLRQPVTSDQEPIQGSLF